jgi:hypothetical protein
MDKLLISFHHKLSQTNPYYSVTVQIPDQASMALSPAQPSHYRNRVRRLAMLTPVDVSKEC